MSKIQIREAVAEDCPALVNLIQELAIYEKAEHEVEITAEQLARDGFGHQPLFHVLVAELEEEIL